MPKFTYSAIESASGKEKKGVLESASSEQASAELKAMGLIPTALAAEGSGGPKLSAGAKKDVRKLNAPAAPASTQLRAKKKKGGMTFGRIISNANLTVFTRQLATLVNAGMPIMRSLETLARQEKNPLFKDVVESLVENIRSGGNFSDGLLQHPKVFDRLYVNMVKAGEAGGVLGTVLDRLSRFMEKAEKIKGKVKSAMTYPVIIVFVAVAIVGALMVFVIPQFEKIFSGMLKGQSMPGLTLAVLAVSNFVKNHIIATIGIFVALYFSFKAWHKTKGGTRAVDWFLLHAPGVGPLFLKSSISRFTRTLGTLLASGVPILQALIITRDTSGNVHVADALNVVHDRVKEGDNVARPLDSTKVFPTMVTSMIEVGEETGALPEMLNRVADTYDEEVDNSVAGLTSIIEPVMIVFMAVMVGTIVIALFLPIVKIIQSLS
ncbi:type II secretion system F family protein [Rariglobus hedericola]|uniref:Type II secretion system F family protein n=1 Tax=Rariglobus hedericola TaxID=2597822 RepID=A0A556QMW6_9BACT|nr:type II secretion system F family protein [Rariglobus hedericola]TSJ77974.1 type II secretion system F family protein [Rariglobus hedericola]